MGAIFDMVDVDYVAEIESVGDFDRDDDGDGGYGRISLRTRGSSGVRSVLNCIGQSHPSAL